jgi:hypothetical protein
VNCRLVAGNTAFYAVASMTSPQHPPALNAAMRKGEIVIVMATRGRPHFLVEAFKSLGATTTRKDLTSLWIYVDEDDQVTRQVIENKSLPDPGLAVHWHIGPQPGGLGETHQTLWKASQGAAEIYVTTVDDARFATPGWDEIIRAKYHEYPDGLLLAFPHDPHTADQATYPILGGNWIKTIGHLYPGYFPYWFDDKWVDEVGRMAGRCVKLPLMLPPIGGKGRTKRMRNHAFWTRFYHLTLDERKESARKLINAMHPNDETKRRAALASLEEVAKKYELEKENCSDAYSVFQEERHTEMTPEERLKFNLKYFTHETKIVGRLVARAAELVAQKQFTEAKEILDCIQLSDIKVRQAHALMVECLRGLGRHAEADRINFETVSGWPQMNFLRRCFRFLGMVVNDGKRMILGLTSKGKQGK